MKNKSVEIPSGSEISLIMERTNHLECTVKLLVNGKEFGAISAPKGTTGKFELIGLRTPKSGKFILNFNPQFNFDFSLFGKIFGLEE